MLCSMGRVALQQEYLSLVCELASTCTNRLGSYLQALYVGGSVAAGEAWPESSDVDSFMITSIEPSLDDKRWCDLEALRLAEKYPIAKEVHLNLYSIAFLREEQMLLKFILRYNAQCVIGASLLENIERAGFPIACPSKELAKGRLWFVKKCVRGLDDGHFPDGLFGSAVPNDLSLISNNDWMATRKIVRNYILVEGAYLLMLTGDFRSFHREDVLDRIAALYPESRELMQLARKVMTFPVQEKVAPQRAREILLPFLYWVIARTESL
jgi:hypothetical protein